MPSRRPPSEEPSAFFGLTDWDWFQFLSAEPELDEVNFWRPSDTRQVHWPPGKPFVLKLRAEHGGWVVGFGYFAGYTVKPMWMAWEAFERKNGAESFAECRRLIAAIREKNGLDSDPAGSFAIGCLMISQPVFFERADWVRPPADWPASGLQGGKSMSIVSGEGARVWTDCLARAGRRNPTLFTPAGTGEGERARYGQPVLTRPRLGQGAFRMLVTDVYGACAVTREHSLPVLEAAHIRPYANDGPHEVGNGLLLRTDIHRLFDKGYVTVTPEEHKFVVSNRLKDDYGNGKSYKDMHGRPIELPRNPADHPSREFLEWHAGQVFKG